MSMTFDYAKLNKQMSRLESLEKEFASRSKKPFFKWRETQNLTAIRDKWVRNIQALSQDVEALNIEVKTVKKQEEVDRINAYLVKASGLADKLQKFDRSKNQDIEYKGEISEINELQKKIEDLNKSLYIADLYLKTKEDFATLRMRVVSCPADAELPVLEKYESQLRDFKKVFDLAKGEGLNQTKRGQFKLSCMLLDGDFEHLTKKIIDKTYPSIVDRMRKIFSKDLHDIDLGSLQDIEYDLKHLKGRFDLLKINEASEDFINALVGQLENHFQIMLQEVLQKNDPIDEEIGKISDTSTLGSLKALDSNIEKLMKMFDLFKISEKHRDTEVLAGILSGYRDVVFEKMLNKVREEDNRNEQELLRISGAPGELNLGDLKVLDSEIAKMEEVCNRFEISKKYKGSTEVVLLKSSIVMKRSAVSRLILQANEYALAREKLLQRSKDEAPVSAARADAGTANLQGERGKLIGDNVLKELETTRLEGDVGEQLNEEQQATLVQSKEAPSRGKRHMTKQERRKGRQKQSKALQPETPAQRELRVLEAPELEEVGMQPPQSQEPLPFEKSIKKLYGHYSSIISTAMEVADLEDWFPPPPGESGLGYLCFMIDKIMKKDRNLQALDIPEVVRALKGSFLVMRRHDKQDTTLYKKLMRVYRELLPINEVIREKRRKTEEALEEIMQHSNEFNSSENIKLATDNLREDAAIVINKFNRIIKPKDLNKYLQLILYSGSLVDLMNNMNEVIITLKNSKERKELKELIAELEVIKEKVNTVEDNRNRSKRIEERAKIESQ